MAIQKYKAKKAKQSRKARKLSKRGRGIKNPASPAGSPSSASLGELAAVALMSLAGVFLSAYLRSVVPDPPFSSAYPRLDDGKTVDLKPNAGAWGAG